MSRSIWSEPSCSVKKTWHSSKAHNSRSVFTWYWLALNMYFMCDTRSKENSPTLLSVLKKHNAPFDSLALFRVKAISLQGFTKKDKTMGCLSPFTRYCWELPMTLSQDWMTRQNKAKHSKSFSFTIMGTHVLLCPHSLKYSIFKERFNKSMHHFRTLW